MSETKAPALVPSVGYLRKSTKGKQTDRDGGKYERQEKSISEQRTEILKLVAGRYRIIRWFEDEGVSGWKRGAKRPDFAKMLAMVKELGAQAIVCDNIDRFSRATVAEVQGDATALHQAGVRWIVTASHGVYDLGKPHDIGEILKFVVGVWSASEYSRQLSRRIVRHRGTLAEEGARSGGVAPYGWVLTGGKGKRAIKHGDPKQIKVVRWLFGQYANHARSLNSLAAELNSKKEPSPGGGPWYVTTVRELLKRRVYIGDFEYNKMRPSNKRRGHFHTLDQDGNVVELPEVDGKVPGKFYLTEGQYEPMVDRDLFLRVQRRLTARKEDRRLRVRMGYALTGVLICDHCGRPMHGTTLQRRTMKTRVYRCSSDCKLGQGACATRQVREDRILPFVLRMLSQELADLKTLLTQPPEETRNPRKAEAERRQQAEAERDKLQKRIARAEENLLYIEDARTRKSLDQQVSIMRDDLDKLVAELTTAPIVNGLSVDDLDALTAWWEDVEADLLPCTDPSQIEAAGDAVALDDEGADAMERGERVTKAFLLVDPRKVNEALLQLGCEVRLRWDAKTKKNRFGKTVEYVNQHTGKTRPMLKHTLARGRFRLGQHSGQISFSTGTAARVAAQSRPGQTLGNVARLRTLLSGVDRTFAGADVLA